LPKTHGDPVRSEQKQTLQSVRSVGPLSEAARWLPKGIRDEQRKFIKYNHLVDNLLIFHDVRDHE
jgi:hypothetical protein